MTFQKGNSFCFTSNLKHGHARIDSKSKTYRAWQDMLSRCKNEKGYTKGNCRWATRDEQNRNQRSNRWLTYKGETLCVADWATKLKVPSLLLYRRLYRGWNTEQTLTALKNARPTLREHNHKVTFKGVVLSLTEWARRVGLNPGTLRSRLIAYGWPIERALTTLARAHNR